jgi:sucrose-phosphate synthase
MNKKIYIQMFSIHGLLRFQDMELGRDADTGGQIKYVVELAQELSKFEEVNRVDVFTRLISDRQVSSDYGVQIETINRKYRIIRIQCGGRKYMRKELLWPYLDEFIDKTLKFTKQENRYPDIIHAHYADAGYVGMQLSEYFGAPFVFTGHSLGRAKQEKLRNDGMNEADIDKQYKIDHRIQIEEEVIKNADLIVTSTSQEIEKQYGMYRNKNLPQYRVIPPGIDLAKFYPFYHDLLPDTTQKTEESIRAHASIIEELHRFFLNPGKPLVLALCRADRRKNITGLIEAFGNDPELKTMANLAIFAGIRKDIVEMEDNEKEVLTEMLLMMDKFDLYGKMAIPKKHDFTYEVPELYRITGRKKGVFVNAAFTEPFGLSLIEAAASGVPIVATNDGGPRDILKNCVNGILVDPHSPKDISDAIKKLITDEERWTECSNNGVKGVNEHYRWKSHASEYLSAVKSLSQSKIDLGIERTPESSIGDRFSSLGHFLICDIDNTLTGNDLRIHHGDIGFGVATGRTVESAVQVINDYQLILPDIIISSVGAEMYYRGNTVADKGWQTHINKKWDRAKIKRILDELNFLTYQEEETQRDFKISYFMEPKKDRVAQVHALLTKNKCYYNLIYSHDEFLDILPHRASKGKAIRYLIYKWGLDPKCIVVCGDSGNDEEMLRTPTMGVIVSNHTPELDTLKNRKNVYFSSQKYASGILDGLEHYNFIDKVKSQSCKQ